LLARGRIRTAGSFAAAGALALYAVAFSWAYLRIGAGLGALVLFGAVQVTMLGWGLVRGERPGLGEGAGLALALVGLAILTAPGWGSGDALGTASMLVAGVAWGAYSLLGRGAGDPLAATAGNFARALPAAAVLAIVAMRWGKLDGPGVALAVASGAIASGLGYVAWYAALRGLRAVQAGVVQLAVPVLAAAAGAALLAEHITLRLVAAGAAILAGIALAVFSRRL
jgi:drug/metabolite transporter (DMT)-like permease